MAKKIISQQEKDEQIEKAAERVRLKWENVAADIPAQSGDDDFSRKVVEYTASTGTHTISSTPSLMVSPAHRRRAVGDSCRTVDAPGFWAHIRSDISGVPSLATLIHVDDQLSSFKYLGKDDDDQWRSFERLPREGIFIFLW